MISHDRSRFLRGGVGAASLVNLAMLGSWVLLLDAKRSSINWGSPTWQSTLAPVAVCLLAFLLGGVVALAWPRLPAIVQTSIELIAIACGVFVLNGLRIVSGMMLPQVDALLTHHAVIWVLAGTAIAVTGFVFRKRMARAFMLLLLVFSPYLALNLVRAMISAVRTDYGSLNPAVRGSQPDPARPGMRVVMIVFDELDYNFAFANRPHDLLLPSFDHLRTEALFATAADPPGRGTQFSMPTYLTGKPVMSIVRRGVSSLDVAVSGNSVPFDVTREQTIFSDAFDLGARSELVGFFLPYCRWQLAAYLDKCTWFPFTEGGVLDGRVGFVGAVVRQVQALALIGNRLAQIDRVEGVTTAGMRAVSDPTERLVFLHIPSPHMPPIWDRKSGSYSVWKYRTDSYFDNLALTDRILGSLVKVTRDARLDQITTLIITSDHPWRLGAIDGKPPGTTVPYLVRMPDHIGVEWSAPFATVQTRYLVRALLSGAVKTTPQLEAWLASSADSAVIAGR
jgi:hypothetical protein